MTGPKKYLRTEGGERIDQPDFEHAAEESQLTGLTQLTETFVVGPLAGPSYPSTHSTGADQRFYVLSGMKVTYPAPGGSMLINVGNAILSWEDQGATENGVILNLTAAQPLTLSGTLAAAGAGVKYGVYAKYSLQDAQAQNRNFWNALAATPTEITRQIFTRRVDALELTFAASGTTPGTEWMLLAEIEPAILSAGTQTGITDKRVFYFEGAVANSYQATEWGEGPNDRNSDRDTYGVTGLRTMIRALQRQVSDIIDGGNSWWVDPESLSGGTPVDGLTLYTAKMEAYSMMGHNADRLQGSISGDVIPSNQNAYDIGQTGLPWRTAFANKAELGTYKLTTAAEAQEPRIVTAMSAFGERTKIWESAWNDGAASGIETIRIYRSRQLPESTSVAATDNVYEMTINAEWNQATSLWECSATAAAQALLMSYAQSSQTPTQTGLKLYDRTCAAGDSWAHATFAGAWVFTTDARSNGLFAQYISSDGGIRTTNPSAGFIDAITYLEAGTKIVNDGMPDTNATMLGGDIYRTGTPKAWGTIRINNQDLVGPANSAVFLQSPTPASTAGGASGLLGGQGLSSVSWNSPHLRVTLADNYSNANGRSIVEAKFVGNSTGTVMPIVFSHLAPHALTPLDVITWWPAANMIEFRCPNNTNVADVNYHQAGAIGGWHNLYTTDFTAAMYLQFIVWGEISV